MTAVSRALLMPLVLALAEPGSAPEDVRRELACDGLAGATAARQAACPEHADEEIAAGDEAARDLVRTCGRGGDRKACRERSESWKRLIVKAQELRMGEPACQRAKQRESEARDQLRTLAGAGADLGRQCPPCTAAGGRATYRGRVVAASGDRFDSWTEVEVEGADNDAAAICQAQLTEAVETVRRLEADLAGRVDRACTPAGLPAVRAGGGWLLIDRRTLEGRALNLVTLQRPCLAKRGQRTAGVLTSFTRFAQAAACEQARQRLETSRRDSAEGAAEHAHEWLRDELAAVELKAKDGCAAAAERAPWLARSARQASLAKAACRGGSTGAACERARRRALEAVTQAMEAERLQRTCERDRDLARALRQKLEAPAPALPAGDVVTCVAETRSGP